MTTKFLTPKQKQVLDHILEYQQVKGYAPSQQEIAQHFGFSSLGTVQHYLSQLSEQGYLQKEWNARRGLTASSSASPLPPSKKSITSIPLLGRVAAGRPIEAVRNHDAIE